MNIKEYIESGILEAYILGSLTDSEVAEVAANIAQYPEIADEALAIEMAMQQFAGAMAKEPPAGLQDKIWGAMQKQSLNTGNEVKPQTIAGTTIPFQPEYRKLAMWKMAAVWVGLLISIALNALFFKQKEHERLVIAAVKEQITKIQAQQQQTAALIKKYDASRKLMADTAIQTIVMHTVKAGNPIAATIYWRKDNGEAYVDLNSLPQPANGKQYQLWVIQDGKPVSMGVLPDSLAGTPEIQKIAMTVTSGQAFAISLEKEGGNPTPTEVCVVGKI